MRESLIAATVTCAAMLGCLAPSLAQENADQKLGTVHFATSCNETAQRRFDRAMRYQHSFWYRESKDIYEEALKADPECAIAEWGVALSLLSNPHNAIPAPNLPLGLADKVVLALAEPEALPAEGNLRGATMRTAMGSFHLRPFGQPCIEGFFGGRFARELEDAGDGAIAAHSIDEIVSFLGSDFRRKLRPLKESRWAHDPFARGSYSHALPGHAGKRAVLAAPVDGRLFFAGEATSPHFFSTAHGAHDSGERAAREVLQAINK